MHNQIRLFALVAVFATSSLAAHADTFEYNFKNTSVGRVTEFTYNSPALLTSITDFVPDTCSGFGHSCLNVELDPTSGGFWVSFVDTNGMDAGTLFGQFITGFGAVGTYATFDTTLSISDVPSSVTPEPSTLALFGTGILGLIGVGRRNFFQA